MALKLLKTPPMPLEDHLIQKKIGSCQFSDISVFSFHPVKIITTCEGGICTTNDKRLFQKMYNLRSHGIVRNQEDMKNTKHGPWYYEQIDLGFNYRLNDLQAVWESVN